MKNNHIILRFLGWAILLFIVLQVSSAVEHRLTTAVAVRLSPPYARSLADWKKTEAEQIAKDPAAGGAYELMGATGSAVRGITALLIAGLVVWRWRAARGMPNTALEPTPTAP